MYLFDSHQKLYWNNLNLPKIYYHSNVNFLSVALWQTFYEICIFLGFFSTFRTYIFKILEFEFNGDDDTTRL